MCQGRYRLSRPLFGLHTSGRQKRGLFYLSPSLLRRRLARAVLFILAFNSDGYKDDDDDDDEDEDEDEGGNEG